MTTTKFATNVLGADFNRIDTAAAFDLGTMARDNDGGEWLYCQADGAVTAAGYVVQIDRTFQAIMTNTTESASARGERLGVSQAGAIADNEYAWFQVHGPCEEIRVAASCVANVRLNTTATSGQLDDDGTSGAEVADGVYITTTEGGAAGTEAGLLVNAAIGATL